ncbi:MAG: RNA polymerase sigma factor [Oscillospiraceae bacterium]|nr:RNA polymerase sigma factor [Oscillospiraceae bacterium]
MLILKKEFAEYSAVPIPKISKKMVVSMTKLDRAVSLLANGDKSAFSAIYDLMARLVYSVAYTVVENHQDAEDVMQDTFMDINKYIGRYEGKGAKSWILSMAHHRAIDVVRRRKPNLSIDDTDEFTTLAYNDDYSKLEVSEMLKSLTPEERQIIMYRVYGKMSHKEIAEITGLSEATAQKKYRRALEKLRKEWR